VKYQKFIFEDYQFNTDTLELHYSFDGIATFTETFRFDFPFANYRASDLDRACQTLFFMAGVSYYKAYLAPEIVIKKGAMDAMMSGFFSRTYQRGLGEFFYMNHLSPRTAITFPVTVPQALATADPDMQDIQVPAEGLLVGLGGGKDSLVSVELLRGHENLTTWSLNHRSQLTPLVQRIGLPHACVERTWDTQLLELNAQNALNGHIPISAIFACAGTVVAILTGKRDIVTSNEQSANEPSLHYQGMAINHQYSKSQDFERDYQQYLKHTLGDRVRYYSFLRPLSEVRIAEIFAQAGFEKYRDVFSSCNRAFVHSSDHMSWCGECSKCAFVFMALTPFVSRQDLEQLWGGKNLLLEPALEPTYRKLLGIEGNKPLDCVGDIKESRLAMQLAFQQYPQLAEKYHFVVPEEYDYSALGSHEMPPEIYQEFTTAMAKF